MKRQNEVWSLERDSEDSFDEGRPLVEAYPEVPARCKPSKRYPAFLLAVVLAISFLLSLLWIRKTGTSSDKSSREEDFEISHHWGQYSPFFSVKAKSETSPAIPPQCNVTFVQVLSRHGARYPTAHKSAEYAELVSRIHQTATAYKSEVYTVLRDYRYTLGTDDLTLFGEQEMRDMGDFFYRRYAALARQNVPFVRASGSDRVIASGKLFTEGFNQAKTSDPAANKTQKASTVNLVIPEGHGWNNTLDAGTCSAFSDGSPVHDMLQEFLNIFAPPILERLKNNMPGVDLELQDVPHLMDLCPFETVNNVNATPSPLCDLFTIAEWKSYDYFKTLEKYYGYGAGNPLGSTRGVGYVNEIISRMTKSLPVMDHTSVNHTLDSNPATFPLDTALYADFSHDNSMVSIFDAFGLYNGTMRLSPSRLQPATETDGFSASWVVPFAARAYFEVMQCSNFIGNNGEEAGAEEIGLVRVLVNDRVVPLYGCHVDELGRCRLNDWIAGLDFAREGGHWDDYCPQT